MPLHYEDPQVQITKVVVGPMVNNVFVVRCAETGESVLFDAADEPEVLLPLCEELNVGDVITTHGHRDHIQAVPEVRQAGHRVGVAQADAGMLPAYDFEIADDDVIEVGRLRLHAIHTPGHGDDTTIAAERPHLQEWIDRGW